MQIREKQQIFHQDCLAFQSGAFDVIENAASAAIPIFWFWSLCRQSLAAITQEVASDHFLSTGTIRWHATSIIYQQGKRRASP